MIKFIQKIFISMKFQDYFSNDLKCLIIYCYLIDNKYLSWVYGVD